MEVAIDAASWVVGKAVGPLSSGLLEAWAASSELGPNINAVKMELLYAKGMLDNAQGREIRSQALKELLHQLQQLAYDADDMLDELDYFRIHDELKGTYEAADVDGSSYLHGIIVNSRHTAKAVVKSLQCSRTDASHGDPDKPREDARRHAHVVMSKCLPCFSCPLVHDGEGDDAGKPRNGWQRHCDCCNPTPGRKRANEMPTLKFDRVGISTRMKHLVEQLQPVCAKVSTILNMELLGFSISTILNMELQGSSHINTQEIAMSQRITISESVEPKLYGRNERKDQIIRDITQGIYCEKDLSVLSLFGPGGIGKTTLIQHIYNDQKVKSHFQVKLWVCVSFSFNASRLIKQIEKSIPRVDDEKPDGSAEERIEQRLKSKRFLLILDDMWKCDDEDEWKRLLAPFRKGQAKGNMVMVTTRSPALAEMVKTDHAIGLERLEGEEFVHLFEACVFGDEKPSWEGHSELLDIGTKIIAKLKGSPLAAKTVGRLLRKNLTLDHWTRVLASKEWESQKGGHEIMPALKLSYLYLPFHLQKCFSYCALFPYDHEFDSGELIHLWMGLNILCSSGQNKTLEEVGLSCLNDLVDHGFFKRSEKFGHSCYVIHDLLHDLARMVSSYECLTIDYSKDERCREIPPHVRHLSIIMGDVQEDGIIGENVRRDLINTGKRFKAEDLHTMMIFGEYDRSLANTFSDLFRKTKALRVLRLFTMYYDVEHMLQNFSELIHLRYLKLESKYDKICLPSSISRFYKLIVLDLKNWKGSVNLPADMSNLISLHHFVVSDDEPHSKICEVGKLQMLQELRRFEVKSAKNGFELRQLEQLTELSGSLSICNLEKVQVKEEANDVNLSFKNRLKKLTLEWDIQRSNKEPDNEAQVLNVLRPHDNLQELCIRGHAGPSCPVWLGSNLSVKNLQALHLDAVDWNVLPPLGELWLLNERDLEYHGCIRDQRFQNLKRLELVCLSRLKKWAQNDTGLLFSLLEAFVIRDCPELTELPFPQITSQKLKQGENINLFPRIQELRIDNCPKLESVPLIPWTDTLHSVDMKDVGSGLGKLVYSSSSSSSKLVLEIKENYHLNCLNEMLVFHNLSELHELEVSKGPPLMHEHLRSLTSLKTLMVRGSSSVLQPLGGPGDAKYKLPIECLAIHNCSASGKELTELLWQLPELSFFWMDSCQNVTRLGVVEQLAAIELASVPSSSADKTGTQLRQQEALQVGGLLLFPPHLSNSLCDLWITDCPELSLVASLPLQNNSRSAGHGREGGGLHSLRSLRYLATRGCPKFLSAYVSSSSSFCPFPSSLGQLRLDDVEGLETLVPLSNLTALTYLGIENCGEDLRVEDLLRLLTKGRLTRLLVYKSPKCFAKWESWMKETTTQQQEELQDSIKLRRLQTDDVAGFLVAPICTFFSSASLTELALGSNKEIVHFTKEQEKALGLITSLQELRFFRSEKLQSLPASLHTLHSLKILRIIECPEIRSLPKNGLPSSMQQIVLDGCNEELEHQCIMLEGITVKFRK